jgi:hypothetical protein
MDKNPLQKVREALYERLANFDFTEDVLKDKSLFQLVTLEMLLVGHRNYIGTYTCTCRTLEELGIEKRSRQISCVKITSRNQRYIDDESKML